LPFLTMCFDSQVGQDIDINITCLFFLYPYIFRTTKNAW
jgi:hypothetical protein